MGSCETSDVKEINPDDADTYNHNSEDKSLSESMKKTIESQKAEFPDMKEWKGNRYMGVGIKKMKGYKCKLPIDKLNEKRQKFWDLRNQKSKNNPNYKIWRIINQACVYDEYRANMLLQECQLTTAKGCINHIIDKKGNHYIIPNYCINDPFFEKNYKVEDNVEQENIDITLFDASSNQNFNFNVSNLLTGEEFKKIIMKKLKIPKNFKIRLFYSGMEIKDAQFLYQHKIKKDYKIQIMKLPIIEGDGKE